jgi:DNA-binding CsgD family transcriptional regulator/DNA-binding XRE family transcriptional regulator
MDDDPGDQLVPAHGSPVREARQFALGPDKPERDDLLLAFGQNLRAQRALAGLTQQTLAERCFLRTGQISLLERGKTTPNLFILLMLADVAGVGVGELVSGLAAPSRRASREQILALVTQQPGIGTAELAGSLGLPSSYVSQTARRMHSYKEVVWRPMGWETGPRQMSASGGAPLLTRRESEVLGQLHRGKSNAEVALALKIGVETVRTYVASVLRKNGVRSRQELVRTSTPEGEKAES